MEWKAVQTHYKKLYNAAKRRGLTQTKIADSVGLAQPDVSRLMSMTGDDGPQVGTLLKAIEGLGLTPSTFFRQLEAPTSESPADLQNEGLPLVAGQGKDRAIVPPDARGFYGVALSEVDPDVAARVGRALINAGLALARPDAGDAAEQPDRAVSKARRKK